MDDDWRLQIDLDDAGIGGQVADLMRSAELEHDLELGFDQEVIVSHEGERIFLYAGTRAHLERAGEAVRKILDTKGWDARLDLRHWHPDAAEWEAPDVPEPRTDAEREAEHERLMRTEGEEAAAKGGRAEFEVRIEFPSHGEARDFAARLKEEELEPVRRWRYMVVGAADEDAAAALAERIRAEAPADAKVTAEGSLHAAWEQRPPNPFFFLGGLADG